MVKNKMSRFLWLTVYVCLCVFISVYHAICQSDDCRISIEYIKCCVLSVSEVLWHKKHILMLFMCLSLFQQFY